ncbi:MAG: hypothetical protein U0X39_07915 [Bacteroidales bacterium]
MTVDNRKTIVQLRIRLFIATVLLIAWIIVIYFAKAIKFPLLGMEDNIWTLILVIIYFIIAFYPMFLNYQYIFYSDEDDKIIVRYYNTGIATGKKNSVEIRKDVFAGYKVEKKLLGLDRQVILFQKVPKGIAKYPPLHIGALTKSERGKILNSLYQHSPADAAEVK